MRQLFSFFAIVLAANVARAQEADLAVLPTLVEESARAQFPALFDEFLLTAVQDVARVPVIGKDDIDAVLGFEKTKELMGCDDVSCMADIGGALGVAKLVHAKIDKLDKGKGNWVVTTKLIESAGPTVQARTSDFVSGDAQALLEAIKGIVTKLFAGGGMGTGAVAPVEKPKPKPLVTDVERVELTPTPRPTYDDSYGSGSRIGGILLMVAGVGAGIAGAAVAVAGAAGVDADLEALCGDDDICWDENQSEYLPPVATGVGIAGAGLALAGVGQSMYLNGRARAHAANNDAKGYHDLTWLGWVFTGVAVALPLLDAAVSLEPLGTIGGITGLVGAAGVWTYTMVSDSAYTKSPTTGARYPMAKVFMLRDRNNEAVPAYGFSLAF